MMLRDWVIKKWITTEDCLEHIESIDNIDEKHRVLTLAVQRMFNVVSAEDILRQNPDGSWSYGNKILTGEQLTAIQHAMDSFSKGQLYKILKADLKHHATMNVAFKSKNEMDIIAGKVLLTYIDVVDKRLKSTLIKES